MSFFFDTHYILPYSAALKMVRVGKTAASHQLNNIHKMAFKLLKQLISIELKVTDEFNVDLDYQYEFSVNSHQLFVELKISWCRKYI